VAPVTAPRGICLTDWVDHGAFAALPPVAPMEESRAIKTPPIGWVFHQFAVRVSLGRGDVMVEPCWAATSLRRYLRTIRLS